MKNKLNKLVNINNFETKEDLSVQELIKVNYDNPQRPVVSGRELYKALGIKTAYKDWFPRMCEYGFEEDKDFCSFLSESTGGRPAVDHNITISMAKELCMIQRTNISKQIRKYFIAVEEEYNSPEKLISRALILANDKIEKLEMENKEMKPKSTFYDEYYRRKGNENLRDSAKMLSITEKELITTLFDKKLIQKNGLEMRPTDIALRKGILTYNSTIAKTNGIWAGHQTLITPKGLIYLAKIFPQKDFKPTKEDINILKGLYKNKPLYGDKRDMQIIKLRNDGLTIREISEKVKWSKSTINNVLKNNKDKITFGK